MGWLFRRVFQGISHGVLSDTQTVFPTSSDISWRVFACLTFCTSFPLAGKTLLNFEFVQHWYWYIIHFIPLPIFGIPWCCSQLSTDKYLRHIRICLRVIYLPSYQGCLIQGCSTYNHLENFEFENIVRQPPTHVSLYVLTFVTWIHLRHDSSNTTKIPFHRPMPDTRHRVAVATSTKSPDHHGNTISCFWFV